MAAKTKEEVFGNFGPKLIEALALVLKDEINPLRREHSFPERSDQQIIDAIAAKIDVSTNDYDSQISSLSV